MDLLVWESPSHEVLGFQLSYDLRSLGDWGAFGSYIKKTLNWEVGKKPRQWTLDEGDMAGCKPNMTPIMMPNGPIPKEHLSSAFRVQAEKLPKEVRQQVLKVIEN